MIPKLSNLSIVLCYWNENMNQGFRFNNPKQCSNWIILVSFCSSYLAIKLLQCSFYENWKNWCKNRFFRKKFKKFMYYNEELVYRFKFQTQLSRKLQRFRTCRKNKKCSIFHDLSEYIIFSYGCKLLDWSFKYRVIQIFVTLKFAHNFFYLKFNLAKKILS